MQLVGIALFRLDSSKKLFRHKALPNFPTYPLFLLKPPFCPTPSTESAGGEHRENNNQQKEAALSKNLPRSLLWLKTPVYPSLFGQNTHPIPIGLHQRPVEAVPRRHRAGGVAKGGQVALLRGLATTPDGARSVQGRGVSDGRREEGWALVGHRTAGHGWKAEKLGWTRAEFSNTGGSKSLSLEEDLPPTTSCMLEDWF